jgi:hypothetical protein
VPEIEMSEVSQARKESLEDAGWKGGAFVERETLDVDRAREELVSRADDVGEAGLEGSGRAAAEI